MLKEKIIIVTGGSGLLGRSIIQNIKSLNGLVINFDLETEETNLKQFTVKCDITDTGSIDQALALVYEKYGRIDGLVNNAYPRTKDWGNKFEMVPKESWDKNLHDQLSSYFYACQKVSEYMIRNGSGSIVNMASIYGVVGPDLTVYEGTSMTLPAAYSAIKGGIVNFTRYLASYLGKYQIRANCVSPGGIFDNQPARFVSNYEKKVPLGRMGKPDDIAPVVSFLLSDQTSYLTGQNIIVDGGWTAI